MDQILQLTFQSQISEEWSRFVNHTMLYFDMAPIPNVNVQAITTIKKRYVEQIQQIISKEPNPGQLDVRGLNITNSDSFVHKYILNQKERIAKDIPASKIPL